MYTYTHIHMLIYVYSFMNTYIYNFTHTCIHTCISTHVFYLQKQALHSSPQVTELELLQIDVTKMVKQHNAPSWFTASTRALAVVEDREYQERMRAV